MSDLSHFDEFDQPISQIAHAVYEFVGEVSPDLHRMKRWGFPGFVANSTIGTICCHPSHVNLQLFNGIYLADPAQLLEGNGKTMRHVKFRVLEDLQQDGLRELILSAVEYDKTLRDEGLRAKAEK